MVKIDYSDSVLNAADAEMERRDAARPRRLHLGMSTAGRCPRQQWYSWLWASAAAIAARGLCAIDDGNRGEDVIAARIQMVDDVLLQTVDPETGRQFEVVDAGGHLRGHFDGIVHQLPVAPKTPHVWECKIVNERKFAQFKKIKERDGEKATLKEWDFTYWVQGQLYMLYGGFKRHWLVVASAGCRNWDSCRTELNVDEAEYFAERLRSMVENVNELPERVSESPKAFACKWCDYRDVCHEGVAVQKNCRTCRFSTPVDGPQWHCGKHDAILTPDQQAAGCDGFHVREAMA